MSSLHFIPFYFTQHNNTVHVVFFCTEAFPELVTNQAGGNHVSEKLFFFCFFMFFFFFLILFYFFPLKNINFHKRSV